MWSLITGDMPNYGKYASRVASDDDGFIQPFEDSPVDNVNVAEGAYLQLINNATKYIYITTPYLIPDDELLTAIRNAADSGVDVRIVTPHLPDKVYVQIVTRSNYQFLLDSGVKIYEYTPGFMHQKMICVDDEAGMVGTVNLDFRSFYLQFECGVWLYKSAVIKQIKEDFKGIFKVSKLVDSEKWRKRPAMTKMIEILLRIFSPML